jgi:hypothetical protein
MRPDTPLAAENSVGKPAAKQAPNAGMGKRACAVFKRPSSVLTAGTRKIETELTKIRESGRLLDIVAREPREIER